MQTEPFFNFNQVSYDFSNGTKALSDINWHVPIGGFHCLVGRSGCGKTTLLKLAAGLLLPSHGEIRVADAALTSPSQNIGFVFQNPALLEWRTVLENVLLPISLHRKAGPNDHTRAHNLLAQVGLDGLANRYPAQLSGGQQSRVALVRALITSPPALLMDEPFAALDAITREDLQDDLLRLVAQTQTTVLFVTHDIGEAVYLGDQVALMDQGRITAHTQITLPQPRQRYGADFAEFCQNIRAEMAGIGGAQ